ncbi:MAG TPA: TRAP transporter small permease [Rhodobacteraceae bacterium]|jgi:TRAP-type C4-dicarboxylate transport system permease small subunit|nr:TRAP transporter small permease [Paracoccaceae bacterium]
MRRILDTAYKAAGGLAALSILGICLLVSAQVMLNILARIGGPNWSFTIPSYADFAGYFLATASFMAMAYTLRAGSHIRVNLLVQNLPEKPRWILELFALSLGAVMAGYATYFTASLLGESYHYGDMSTGMIAVPLWIPQLAMVGGLGLLTIAFLDTLTEALLARAPVIHDAGME